jgi:hypothetical protein
MEYYRGFVVVVKSIDGGGLYYKDPCISIAKIGGFKGLFYKFSPV